MKLKLSAKWCANRRRSLSFVASGETFMQRALKYSKQIGKLSRFILRLICILGARTLNLSQKSPKRFNCAKTRHWLRSAPLHCSHLAGESSARSLESPLCNDSVKAVMLFVPNWKLKAQQASTLSAFVKPMCSHVKHNTQTDSTRHEAENCYLQSADCVHFNSIVNYDNKAIVV